MNRIDQAFASGKRLFIPYLTAGYPDTASTVPAMHALVAAGADIIELGMPFSDPTADGPVIQAASQAALEAGFTLAQYFAAITAFRQRDSTTPIVVFSYYNPIFHHGLERFVARAAEAGADAFLTVDLPFEEQQPLRQALDQAGLHLIQLIAPTTSRQRKSMILAAASGFVYQISLKGVTGARADIAGDALAKVAETRELTSLPVALGFGISTAAQATEIAAHAEAVVVGSAIVRTIGDHAPDFLPALTAQTKALAEATHNAGLK